VETGSADMSVDLSLKEIERIRGKSGVRIIDLPGNEHVFFSMNHRVAPFSNPKVREAMGYAIPVDPILRNVYFGRARPLKSEWPDTYPGVTDKFYKYRFDQARARQLLAEAGFPNGFRTTIMYSAIVAEAEQIAVIIRGALAQIGVDATLERVTGAEFSVRLFGPRKETPAWLNATSKPMTPAIEYMMPIGWLCATPFNAAGYCNRRVDELYETLLEEGNAAKRRQIYDDIQRMIAEDNNTIGLAQWGHHAAMQANIAGYGWYTDARLRLFDLRKQQ
jgi:peptide/nickel transport system substrate-binding protein